MNFYQVIKDKHSILYFDRLATVYITFDVKMSVFVHNNVVSGPEEEYIPAHLSYGQFMFDQLKKGGSQKAVISGETDESVTYKEILENSVKVAIALQRLGLKKGDIVGLSCENRFEFLPAALGVIFAGGILATLNITYSTGELIHLLNITKPKFIFVSPITASNIQESCNEVPFDVKLILFGEYDVIPTQMFNELIKFDVNVDDFTIVDVNGVEEPVAVMCSSGTTGLPKGVMLTHVNFLTLCVHMKYYFNVSTLKKQNKQELVNAMSLIPWFHAYGFITTMAILAMRKKIVFLVRFEEKQFLETIQKYKINMTTIVPPLAVFLAKHPLVLKYDLSSLNEVWCGAAPLSLELQKAIIERTGLDFIKQGYGLTEVTMACCVDVTGKKVGSCGTPAPGMKIKVVDVETGKLLGPNQEGEIWIKSPLRMKGYMGDKAASDALFDKEGYVRTGDVGYYDKDGYFYIVDRLKELIKYKGFQVAPAELEALLLQHRGVVDCGVVGKPDELAGELPIAFVVKDPSSNLTEEEIVKYIASKVSPAKRLRGGIIFVDEIPKNASGKILRRELRKMLKSPKSKL